MKRKIFLLAVAVAALASCSNDETLSVNQGLDEANQIRFRPWTNSVTRASSVADVTTANLTSFTVNAMKANTETSYFSNAVFTGSSGNDYTSTNKYYWPASESLDFYAYSPAGNGQVSYTNYKTFTVTPTAGTDPAGQVDLVYAATKGKNKASNATGVALNFRHTGAKIVCKVKNSSSTLKFGVDGWKVGYLSPSGTFTFADANTDGQNTGSGITLAFGQWGSHAAASISTEYASTFVLKNIAASATATSLDGEMILVPQTLTAATNYASTAADAKLNGTFIAVKLYILNNSTGSELIAGGGTTASPTTIWAIWPIGGYNWEPGKKYTYTIDLSGGGYYEQNNSDGDNDLDPILEGAEIKFVSVTVDDWNGNYYEVPSTDIAYNAVSPSYTVGTAAGTYYFNVTGLTAGKNVEASEVTDANNIISAVSVSPSTVPTSGIVTIAVKVPATTGANSATIKLRNTTDSDDIITITINQPAAS